MEIYITGASGRLGREVLKLIPDAIPLVRNNCNIKTSIVTDFSSDQLKKILKNADMVIHLAGSRDFLDKKKAWEGNVELTRRIVEAMPKTAKIIYSSSISVYGKKLAELPANENTETRPDTPYAKTKFEAEKVITSKHSNHVILRIGPIYGQGFEEYFKVLHMVAKGKMKIIGNGNNHIPFVHVSDVAMAIKNTIEKGQGIYVIVGECLTQKQIYTLAAKALGVETPKKHIPVSIAKLFAHFELFRTSNFGGIPKFIPEDIAVLSSDRNFDCKKAKKELGFEPKKLENGIKEMCGMFR
ncbi:MAG: NAD(P)-dependent oxidoreductase [Candidatus Micrarchaeota archaeon]